LWILFLGLCISISCVYLLVGGTWDDGWKAVGVTRSGGVNTGRLDVFFVTPDGSRRMRSINEAVAFLGLFKRATPEPADLLMPIGPRAAKESATAAITGAVTSISYYMTKVSSSS
jgi:hypothetical protein